MACNRETSADGTTSSPASGCQNPDTLVPCCNNNCCLLGCAATMNLCSKCYSEHLLKEGAIYATKQRVEPCDPTMDTLVVRSGVVGAVTEGAGGTHEFHIREEEATERSEGAASFGRADMMDLRQAFGSKNTPSTYDSSAEVSGVLRCMDASPIMVNTKVDMSDLRHQQIPSPLALSPIELAPRKIETVLVRPPLLPRQQAVNRCLACRKRVGLLGFKCRCGDLFCALHRYSDKHDCSFDYKAAGRAAIAKENPLVKASKVEKI